MTCCGVDLSAIFCRANRPLNRFTVAALCVVRVAFLHLVRPQTHPRHVLWAAQKANKGKVLQHKFLTPFESLLPTHICHSRRVACRPSMTSKPPTGIGQTCHHLGICLRTCIHICMRASIYIYIHMYMYIYIYIYMLSLLRYLGFRVFAYVLLKRAYV